MEYLQYNVTLMIIAGIFKIETDSVIKKVLFNFWRLTVNLTMLFLIVSSFKGLWETNFNFDVKNYVYLIAGFVVWLRITYLVLHDETSFELVKEMRSLFKYKTETGLVEKDLGKYIRLTNKLTLANVIYLSVLGQCFLLIQSLINKSSRSLSLPIWCFFNCKISPYYEMALLLEMFIHEIIAVTVVGADMLFVNSLILLGAQFRLLGWEIKHVFQKTLLKNAVDSKIISSYISEYPFMQEPILSEYFDSEEFKTELVENLNELIKFHQSLVKLSKRLDEFFSPTYLMFLGTLLVDSVFLEYNLIVTQEVILKIEFAGYIIGTAITVFVVCYLGQYFTSQTEEFLHDLYDSPWYMCDNNFMKNFRMLHRRACKPFQFTIGKFGVLSLGTFVGIVRASISYLAVLRQVTKDS